MTKYFTCPNFHYIRVYHNCASLYYLVCFQINDTLYILMTMWEVKIITVSGHMESMHHVSIWLEGIKNVYIRMFIIFMGILSFCRIVHVWSFNSSTYTGPAYHGTPSWFAASCFSVFNIILSKIHASYVVYKYITIYKINTPPSAPVIRHTGC